VEAPDQDAGRRAKGPPARGTAPPHARRGTNPRAAVPCASAGRWLLTLLVLAPARAQASDPDVGPGDRWKALVSIGDVMNLQGWDGTAVAIRGGDAPGTAALDYDGTSGFANGAYLAAYARLDRHFQLGGFLSFVGFGQAAALSANGDKFYRALDLVALGASVKGGGRIHRVVWLGAALDVGLGILLPHNVALPQAGAGLELDPWYGMVVFPRVHVDIAASGPRDAGIGFFWDFGPLFVPIARGSGTGAGRGTELEFSTWSACLELMLGFSFRA
jgi:hypothetical protein